MSTSPPNIHLITYISLRMSGKQPEQRYPVWEEDPPDPRLCWPSEDQFAPLPLDQPVNFNQGPEDFFPWVSPLPDQPANFNQGTGDTFPWVSPLPDQPANFNQGPGDTFPWVSPYIADRYPYIPDPNAAHYQNMGNFVRADPALYLPFEDS